LERLPFTDENLEDEAYRDECDRLAILEATRESYNSTWGRWFIDDGMLSTWVVLPQKEFRPVKKDHLFQIRIREWCTSVGAQSQMLLFVTHQKWVGSSGLKDLKRAFKYLSKKQGVEDDNGD